MRCARKWGLWKLRLKFTVSAEDEQRSTTGDWVTPPAMILGLGATLPWNIKKQASSEHRWPSHVPTSLGQGGGRKVWKPQEVENKLLYCSTFHHSLSGSVLNARWQRPKLTTVLCLATRLASGQKSSTGLSIPLQSPSSGLESCPWICSRWAVQRVTGSRHSPQCWVMCLVLWSPACCYSCMASWSTDCSEGARYFSWRPRVLMGGACQGWQHRQGWGTGLGRISVMPASQLCLAGSSHPVPFLVIIASGHRDQLVWEVPWSI